MTTATIDKSTETTLADIIDNTSTSRFVRLQAKQALNLGTNTMLISLDIGTFLLQSCVGNDPNKGPVTQRKLDSSHALKMAAFIFKGLVNYTIARREKLGVAIPGEIQKIANYLGDQPYYAWSPIVGTIRDPLSNISAKVINQDEGEVILKLRSNQLIWVIDGQHRRMAWSIVRDFLNQLVNERKYTKSNKLVPSELKQVDADAVAFWHEALSNYLERFSVSIELHFGLTLEQEKQLFHDLNNLQKTVSSALAQSFDQANPINIFSHRLRCSELFEKVEIIDDGKFEWDSVAWLKLDYLNAINARLFLNHPTISGANQSVIHERENQAIVFWEGVSKIPGIFDRDQSIAAQPIVLKSMARIYFEILWSRNPEGPEVADNFLKELVKIDFSHSNPIWRLQSLDDDVILIQYNGLMEYVPNNWREKYSYEIILENKIRFGHRHNDTILVLPAIIRYLAKLPPR